MNHLSTLLSSAVAGLLVAAGGVQAADKPGIVFCAEQEKCFGVARAGKNACATATTSCAGTATRDNQKDAWVYVPKGTCLNLAGGILASATQGKP